MVMQRTLSILMTSDVLLVTLATQSWAGLASGLAAYERHEYQTAIKEFQSLADQGDSFAQFMLGYMHAHGEGVSQDYAEAARWFFQAAHKGNSAAQFNLGVLYDEGFGVGQDYAEAARWFRQAADRGNVIAQINMVYLYAKGHGYGMS